MKCFSMLRMVLAFFAVCLGVQYAAALNAAQIATDAVQGAEDLAGQAGQAVNSAAGHVLDGAQNMVDGATEKVKNEVHNAVRDAARDAVDAAGKHAKKQGKKLQQVAADQADKLAGHAEEIFWGLSWPWRIAVIVGVCMLLGCALVCVWSMAKQIFWCALVVAFVGLGVFLYFAFETKAM